MKVILGMVPRFFTAKPGDRDWFHMFQATEVLHNAREGLYQIYDIYREVWEPCSGYASTFGYELADFAAAITEGRPPAVPVDGPRSQPEHSLTEMRTAQALYRSAETGRWERVW